MGRAARGFTLIEILLVIIIIGCAVGIVVLSLPGGPGSTSASRDLGVESQRLEAAIRLAGEQAVLEGRIIGLRIDPHAYQFMVRAPQPEGEATPADGGADEEWRWVAYAQERFPASRQFPDEVLLELELGGLALQSEESRLGRSQPDWFPGAGDDATAEPQIYLLPGGEMTPFQLTLSEPQSEAGFYRQLRGEENGQVRQLSREQVQAEAAQ